MSNQHCSNVAASVKTIIPKVLVPIGLESLSTRLWSRLWIELKPTVISLRRLLTSYYTARVQSSEISFPANFPPGNVSQLCPQTFLIRCQTDIDS